MRLLLVIVTAAAACTVGGNSTDGGDSGGNPTDLNGDRVSETESPGGDSNGREVQSLHMHFHRLPGSLSFRVTLEAFDQYGSPLPGIEPEVETSRGSASTPVDRGDGTYAVTVEPDARGTGEYAVTLVAGEQSLTRTALVLAEVDEQWNQPQKVEGLVNTQGWEDGASITPDGEWLFIQYVPVSPSCLLEANAAACDQAAGPWSAPERPGLEGAATRIDPDGTVHNGCPSRGLDEAFADELGIEFVISAIYGFKRQADGSFAEPFGVQFLGADGCVSPTGVVALPRADRTATIVFAWEDGRDPPGTDWEHWTAEIQLGVPVSLGTYDGPEINDFRLTRLSGTPVPGRQGNPSVVVGAGGAIEQIWYDDESVAYAEQDVVAISLQPGGSFPVGPWSSPVTLPAPVNEPGIQEIQPFFDGNELLLMRDGTIVSVPFLAADLAQIANSGAWGATVTQLAGDRYSFNEVNTISHLGEPTLATRDGRKQLYFIYVTRAANELLDFNVGFVEAR